MGFPILLRQHLYIEPRPCALAMELPQSWAKPLISRVVYEFIIQILCQFILLPETSFGLRVLSLPASVCMPVCLSVCPSVCLSVRLSVCLSVCQSLACPRSNSGPVQARITKFWPKMQKTLVKVPIGLWTDRPWPSRSNFTWKSKFTPLWSCPYHNSPPIQGRITKFGPEVQNTLAKIPIVLRGNWPWSSRSNMT